MGIQIHLKFVEKSIKFSSKFLIFRMIRLGGNIALNLLYVIEGHIDSDAFAVASRNLRKIGIAKCLITNEITFTNGQFDRQFCAVRNPFSFHILQSMQRGGDNVTMRLGAPETRIDIFCPDAPAK